jgi:tetratricopeptide (TPR) repeat protein
MAKCSSEPLLEMQADVSKDDQAMASTGTTKTRGPKTIQGKVRTMADPAHLKTMQEYESALKAMQEGKYDKAREGFRKLSEQSSPEVAERARVYFEACGRQATKQERKFSGPEEQYDYAISLLNTGLYDEAREQLETILAKAPQADYALYGLSILESMTGQTEQCLVHLSAAISINPQNRIHARVDSDFQDMADDPRFTELLYPEVQ